MSLKGGSLFDGIAGFPLAGSRVGFDFVWASEIEPFPIRVSSHHFPRMRHLGSVTEVKGGEIEPVDLITFGSPCQDLSVAGKRAGFDGERSGLFHEAIRIIREMREATNGRYPTLAVWENVEGALSSNSGRDFAVALHQLAEVGAVDIAWRVLDAQWFGVAQRRTRVFVVADFGGERAREILFEPARVPGNPPARPGGWSEGPLTLGSDIAQSGRVSDALEVAPTLNARDWKNPVQVVSPIAFHATQVPISGPQAPCRGTEPSGCIAVAYPVKDASHGLKPFDPSAGGWGVGTEADPAFTLDTRGKAAVAVAYPSQDGRGMQKRQNGLGIGSESAPSYTLDTTGAQAVALAVAENQRGELRRTDIAPSLTTQGGKPGQGYPAAIDGWIVRKLTPLECERLQGFPDNWTALEGAADSARYKALGNSVAVPVVEWFLARAARALSVSQEVAA
jgi:DNA (cytosine-5)-methyltransferase 1